MKTLLVFPPTADPAHPPLGVCSLAGFLRAKGKDASVLDLNLEAHNQLLSSAALTRYSAILSTRLEEFEGRERLPREKAEEYRTIAENLLSSDYLIENIDGARRKLREQETYCSHGGYQREVSVVRRAMELISAVYFPTKWCPGAFTMRYLPTRSRDVLAAIADRQENLFLEFLERRVSEIASHSPDVVGISLNYHCQVIPALTMASLVKKHLPSAYVTIGGGLICFYQRRWEALAPFRSIVDGWIPFEGEEPLLMLIETLESCRRTSGVDGLLTFHRTKPVFRPPPVAPRLVDLPKPDFSDLVLQDYLAPEPILPILASRGCYWGKCAFCSHGHLYRRDFRQLTGADTVKMMKDLSQQYGATCFYLVDEAIPPKLAVALAAEIKRGKLPFRWYGEVRFESYFKTSHLRKMQSGGCRMLMFGLESGVKRVLDFMDKGIDPEEVARILRDCIETGIRTFVMFFIGFPTETQEEAEATVDFVAGLSDSITHVSFTQFILEQYSPVFEQPDRYGVSNVSSDPEDDLKNWSNYAVQSGLSQDEARSLTASLRRDVRLHSVSSPYLLSRSHLVFLPEKDMRSELEPSLGLDFSQPQSLFPIRVGGLRPSQLAFNLDRIREETSLAHDLSGSVDPDTIPQNPAQYVFSPESEKLVEVGPDGISILKACNGRFSLADILKAVGEPNRATTLTFLEELSERGFITCEKRL